MKLSLCMLDIWRHILALEFDLQVFNKVLKPLVEVNETIEVEHAFHSVDLDSLKKKQPKRRLDCKLNIEKSIFIELCLWPHYLDWFFQFLFCKHLASSSTQQFSMAFPFFVCKEFFPSPSFLCKSSCTSSCNFGFSFFIKWLF